MFSFHFKKVTGYCQGIIS
uniref:Uncharacterized protein n=1 Tax=Rhizophora mucronata TaxID=61149 RepID=A0A2P2NP53_RHIMU